MGGIGGSDAYVMGAAGAGVVPPTCVVVAIDSE
jgi:hypothetical protein